MRVCPVVLVAVDHGFREAAAALAIGGAADAEIAGRVLVTVTAGRSRSTFDLGGVR